MEKIKIFDHNEFNSCIKRGMFLLKNLELMAKINKLKFPFDIESCKWGMEQAVINREHHETMMSAVIRNVEEWEYRLNDFNGIL